MLIAVHNLEKMEEPLRKREINRGRGKDLSAGRRERWRQRRRYPVVFRFPSYFSKPSTTSVITILFLYK